MWIHVQYVIIFQRNEVFEDGMVLVIATFYPL